MGLFSRSNQSSRGSVSTDGKGGFASSDNDGVTAASGGDPVDNLIELAGKLADEDEGK